MTIDFTTSNLETDFWQGIPAKEVIESDLLPGALAKLKIMGTSVMDEDNPPPVVFHDFIWAEIASVSEVITGILKSRLQHPSVWKAGETFITGRKIIFTRNFIHQIRNKNQ